MSVPMGTNQLSIAFLSARGSSPFTNTKSSGKISLKMTLPTVVRRYWFSTELGSEHFSRSSPKVLWRLLARMAMRLWRLMLFVS